MPLELDKFDDKMSISDIVLSRIGRARQVRYFRRGSGVLRVRNPAMKLAEKLFQ